MGEFTYSLRGTANLLVGRAASEQAGIFSGDNPAEYTSADPLRVWVIQVFVIMAMTQLLALIFGRIRQPRVIAEIIGGVFLGPTVMGRIPGFSDAIFPAESLPMLNLTSTIGLVLFLFLVGLEIDTRLIKRNARTAAIISLAGLVVPLGMGAALGVGVYKEFISPEVNYGYFLLFVAVAVGITAFPVLCRILTELKLLDTTVGVVVLAAGVGNDVIGWVLLALTVALVNASSGLTALWVFLTSVGFVLFLLFPVKWGYRWVAIKTGSLERGTPTPFLMTLTILMVFISAFFTDIIGVHAIFGGFLAGLVIPHDNGFAISFVEKLEDLVVILFLPLYFARSGLNTNLGLLNDGRTWGYTILIIVVAFLAKFLSCGLSAKLLGFNMREAGAVGSLMACKGLVELIVLNVGLQAGILDTRVFSMFVIHAIILTFITTPLVLLFYPAKSRVHEGSTRVKDKKADGTSTLEDGHTKPASDEERKSRFALVLDRIEQLPAAMTLTKLLNPASSSSTTSNSTLNEKAPIAINESATIDTLRLIELSARTSAVFKSQESELLLHSDPVVAVMRTFGRINRSPVTAALSVVPYDDFPAAISSHVNDCDSQMLLVPWSRGNAWQPEATAEGTTTTASPFDGIFQRSSSSAGLEHTNNSVLYAEYIRNIFHTSAVDTALFVDGPSSKPDAGEQHLFLPFFGGPDDRLALAFLVQLCTANPAVRATVVRIFKAEDLTPSSTRETELVKKPAPEVQHQTLAAADTVYGAHTTETRLASDTADNILWNRLSSASSSNVTFSTHNTSHPLHHVISTVASLTSSSSDVIVLTGRSRRLAVLSHTAELSALVAERKATMGSLVPKTLGDVAAGLVVGGCNAGVLVLQEAASAK